MGKCDIYVDGKPQSLKPVPQEIETKEKIDLEFDLIEAVLDIKRKCAYPDGKPDEKDEIKKVELVAKITSSRMNGQTVQISTSCDDIHLDDFNKYTYSGTFEGVVKNDKLVGKMKAVGKILRVLNMATEPMNLLK